jgi:axin 1
MTKNQQIVQVNRLLYVIQINYKFFHNLSFFCRFACQGLKKQPPDQTDKIFQLVKVINRKFLRSKVVPIAEATRKTIQERIAAVREGGCGQDIFDAAQAEVEDRMTRTTYRNFLASEAYLNYVQLMQTGQKKDEG